MKAPRAKEVALVELQIQCKDLDQWTPSIDRPAYRFLVSGVDAIIAEFVANRGGAKTGQDGPWTAPGDIPWGTRKSHLRDPGRNSLQFYCS